jgi:hypothetical protein
LAEKVIRSRRQRGGDLAGDSEDFATELEREVGSDQRARTLASLDDDRGEAEPRDDAIARGETPRRGLHAGRILGGDRALCANSLGEIRVRARIVAVDAAPEDGDRSPTCFERSAMCFAVDPASKAANDHDTGPRKLTAQLPSDLRSVGRAAAGSDDRHGRGSQRFMVPAHVKLRGRIVKLREKRRKAPAAALDGR